MPKTYLEPRLCTCGCGETIRPRWNYDRQAYSKFKHGHWTRVNPINPRVLSKADEELIAKLYQEGNFSQAALARRFKVSRGVVKDALLRNEVLILEPSIVKMRGRVNLKYFDEIHLPEQAYWLGFIAADGCVTYQSGRFRLSFALKAEDRCHLELFRQSLEVKNKIHLRTIKDSQYVRLGVGGKPLIKQLVSLGITPRKSLTLEYPCLLPRLDKYFMLGYFDGDGSISHSRTCNQLQFSVLGTKGFLTEFGTRLKQACYLKSLCIYSAGHGSRAFQLAYTGNRQVPRIMNWLYKDATVFLTRKRQRYLELVHGGIQLGLEF